MAEHRYYWLKLNKDFFKRHDIRIIESMPNGKDYLLFYLKLLLESVTHEGQLRFSETIPYNEQMLSVVSDTNIDIVRSALKVFSELGMLEILDDETIYMTEVTKIIGSESASAHRVRNSRKSQKALQCNNNVAQCNIDIDIEKEKDIELDIDIPNGIEDEWKAFVEMRKKIKSPLTDNAKKLALSKLKSISQDIEEQKEILNQSVLNCWKGVYPLKKESDKKLKNNTETSYDKSDMFVPFYESDDYKE